MVVSSQQPTFSRELARSMLLTVISHSAIVATHEIQSIAHEAGCKLVIHDFPTPHRKPTYFLLRQHSRCRLRNIVLGAVKPTTRGPERSTFAWLTRYDKIDGFTEKEELNLSSRLALISEEVSSGGSSSRLRAAKPALRVCRSSA